MTISHQTKAPFLALLIAGAVAFAPLPAAALTLDAPADKEAENRDKAMEAYRRGTELYNNAQFEEALASFEEAATLYASPDFQFNMAKCYERLGKYEQAVHHYETYLRTAEDVSDRAVIENTVTDLKQRIAEDEQAEDEAIQAEIDAKTAEAEAKAAAANQEELPSGKPLVIAGSAVLVAGLGVGLGGGLGFGVQVSRDNAALGDVLDGNPEGLTFAEAEALAAQARSNQTLEIVMIGVGGALAVAGAALLVVGVKRNKARDAASEPSPATTAASLRLSPSWGRDGAGLTLQGNF